MKRPNFTHEGIKTTFQGLSAVGTFAIGIAACAALFQTSNVLENVLKIQDQADGIHKAVDLLGEQIKAQVSENAIKSYSESNAITPDLLEDRLKNDFLYKPQNFGTYHLIIPESEISGLAHRISQTEDVNQRARILNESIQIIEAKPIPSAVNKGGAEDEK